MPDLPISVVRIPVDGQWDIADLVSLSEGLQESYGLFYPLVARDDAVRDRLHDMLRKQFWSGDIETRSFGRYAYRAIPREHGLKLKSFQYSSPGYVEIAGVLAVLLMLSKVAQSWIKTGTMSVDLLEKIDKFFKRRKNLKRPRPEFELGGNLSKSSDEARELVFDLGTQLGFDAVSCENLIGIAGNPIAALKFLVAVRNESRKLGELQQSGLIELPRPGEDPIEIIPSDTKRRRLRSGTVVETKGRRRKPASS